MKKLVLALAAVAAFTGSALAADMAPHAYSKAPMPPAPVYSWTGCWISGGGGYGIGRINHDERIAGAPFGIANSTSGVDGWLATAGVGCDYQFNNRWVVGGFLDGTWSDIKGDYGTRVFGVGDMGVGQIKDRWSWAVGARVGYLVAPNFLTYWNTGFTQARFDQVNLNTIFTPQLATGVAIPGQTFDGVFLGSGFEYQFDFLPGLFVKTEGRAAWYNRKDVLPTCVSAGAVCAGAAPAGNILGNLDTDSRKPIVYTAKTELVYRFNWGGPVVAKY